MYLTISYVDGVTTSKRHKNAVLNNGHNTYFLEHSLEILRIISTRHYLCISVTYVFNGISEINILFSRIGINTAENWMLKTVKTYR